MRAHETDIAIIGAGPVGLFAVFECGMLKMRCQVFDSLDAVGGQCTALYPEKPIYDIPGFPRLAAAELIARLAEQAAPFAPVYSLSQQVQAVEARNGGWRVTTAASTEVDARAVIIAAGSGAFGPNRPPLPGIADYEGTSVFYAVARREDLRGQRVVIAGGGDAALDWALSLAEVARKVYVVHRRARFRGAPESVARLHALAEAGGTVELVIPYQLHGLEGRDGRLAAVTVQSLSGEVRRLEADVLLPFFGLSMDLGPIAKWGLALDHQHVRIDPATCQTNAPGIFAIGDIATYPGKLKLILCGFSEAALAAHAAYRLVHPDEALHWEYSTTKGVPGRP
ncbi:MAG TPA: NAD(P)/FAD-dependent oxidoreductase [Kiloniellales bacterium]